MFMDASIRKSKYDDKSMLLNSEVRDFLSAVSMLDDVAERYALRVLIQKNTAIAKAFGSL